jgi:hypothetical protein
LGGCAAPSTPRASTASLRPAAGAARTNATSYRTIEHPAGVDIDLPVAWTINEDGFSVSALAGDDTGLLMFMSVDSGKLDHALEVLNTQLSTVVDDARLSDPREIDLNGMTAVLTEGSGRVPEGPVRLALMLAMAPSGKVLIVVRLVRADSSREVVAAADHAVKSIRPVLRRVR